MALPNLSSARSPTKRRGLDGASVFSKPYPLCNMAPHRRPHQSSARILLPLHAVVDITEESAALVVDKIPSGAERALAVIAHRRNGQAIKCEPREPRRCLTTAKPILNGIKCGTMGRQVRTQVFLKFIDVIG
jgi:hypothetical protein